VALIVATIGEPFQEVNKMAIEVIGVTEVIGQLKEEITGDTLQILREFGDEAAKEIGDRSRAGLDYNERPFAPYAPSYKKYKTEVLKRTGKVDLTVTGDMLRAISHRVITQGKDFILEIFFNNTSSRAPKSNVSVSAKEKALNVNKKFPFFQLNEKQIDDLRNRLIRK
jgi:hypothetical protein